MPRQARLPSGTRLHAMRAGGRWPWPTHLLKYVAALAIVVLFVWNMSLLATIGRPVGELPSHLLRSESHRTALPLSQPPLLRPWFLNPQLYERESGCDFSAAVAALRPEELEINCGNVDELVLGEFLGQGYWREVYRANWKGAYDWPLYGLHTDGADAPRTWHWRF